MVDKKFHCYECAGKARDYNCSTCDGKGNPKIVKKDEQILSKKEKDFDPLDINRDGKVDKEDASIAGKVLANRRKKIINR